MSAALAKKHAVAPPPRRIQRQRKPGWTPPPGAVYVGPGSRWGSPYVIGPNGDAKAVLRKYRDWLLTQPGLCDLVRRELRGKDLVCRCGKGPCHGDVLLEVANGAVATPPSGDTGATGPRQTGVIVDARSIDKSFVARQRSMRVHPLRAMGLSPHLEAVGLRYAHLVEDQTLGGVRASMDPTSWVSSPSSISDGGVTLRIEGAAELKALRAKIPPGYGVVPKKTSQRRKRNPITYQELVNLVCVSGLSLSQIAVQPDYEWNPDGATLKMFKSALIEALEAMADGL